MKLSGGPAGKTQSQVKAANNEKKGQLSMPTGIAVALQASANATLQIVARATMITHGTVAQRAKSALAIPRSRVRPVRLF